LQPSVKKSGAACGAGIGFDLAQDIDDPTFREIERIFHENIVVVFRGQQLSNERHIEFSSRFGELETHIVKKYLLPGYPEILLISNIPNEAGEHIGLADAGFTWHTDTSYRRRPSRCSLLYAKEVPYRDGEALGDTVFANTIAAYEALPASTKQRIDGLKAIHRYSPAGGSPIARVPSSPPSSSRKPRISPIRSSAPIPIPAANHSTSRPASAPASRACERMRRWI
jgi:taurine dioxygenase